MRGAFKPQGQFTGDSHSVAPGVFSEAASSSAITYPTLSDPTKQALWIDSRNRSYTDDGTTRATDGTPVKTITLPSGWDVLSPGGSVTQATLGLRPTYRDDGLQSNGTSSVMSLPASLILTGNYTMYWVGNRGANTRELRPLAINGATFDLLGHDAGDDSGCYAIDVLTSAVAIGPSDNSYCIRRIRRQAGTTYYKRPSTAEASSALAAGTINLDVMLARLGAMAVYTSSGCRLNQIVVVTANLTPGGADDLAIIATLQSLESGVAGP